MLDTPFSLSRRGALKLTLIFLLGQVAFGIIVGFVGGLAKATGSSLPEWASTGNPVMLSLGNISAAFIVLGYGLCQTKSRASELFVLSAPPPKIFALLLFTLGGYVALHSEFSNVFSWMVPPPQWLRRFTAPMHDLAQHPWSGPFALVVMAPLTEELVFRGLILRRLLASVPAWTAIWTSALLFMGMHLNPWQFPIALGSGLLMGWIYARSRSLALCFVAHAFINATSLLAAGLPFTIRGFNTSPASGEVVFQPWWVDLGGAAVLATGLYLFTRTTPPLPSPPVRPEPPLLPVEISPLPAAAPDSALPTA